MRNWILSAEAEECRLLALELEDRPEAPFLLQLASAFDELHVKGVNSNRKRHLHLVLPKC